MEMGYGKNEIIIKMTPDNDSLIAKLMDISEKAMELATSARALVNTIREETKAV